MMSAANLSGSDAGTTPQTSKLKFYILGNNIAHSLSPALHNAGFRHADVAGVYSIFETEHVDDAVKTLVHRSDFAGASVTFPHKLEIQHLMDSVSDRARTIGAVNTIITMTTTSGRMLLGDNTDWAGIKCCIEKVHIRDVGTSCAVIFGAGGAARAACYAIRELGITETIIVNRTYHTANAMAKHFPGLDFRICSKLDEAHRLAHLPIRVIIGCVPADDFDERRVPDTLFTGSVEGVLVEMAYRPLVTGLMKVARRHHGWRVFQGMDVLQEQAFAQFELWTGCTAPKDVMVKAMNDELNRRQGRPA